MADTIALVFLFGIVVALIGLVATTAYQPGTKGSIITRSFAWLGAITTATALLIYLAVDVDGLEKRPCEKVGGVWLSDYSLCLDKDKLPVIKDYKK